MVWVTRPQHRAALAGVAALLGAPALYVVSAGLQVNHAWPTCHTDSTPRQGTSSVPGSSGRDPRAAHRPRHRHLRCEPAGVLLRRHVAEIGTEIQRLAALRGELLDMLAAMSGPDCSDPLPGTWCPPSLRSSGRR